MAITVQPVDGLINRLLQQNGRSATSPKSSSSATTPHDRVSISSHARSEGAPSVQAKQLPDQYGSDRAVQAHAGQDSGSHSASKSAVNSPRERALESHLLDLYRSHDGYGG